MPNLRGPSWVFAVSLLLACSANKTADERTETVDAAIEASDAEVDAGKDALPVGAVDTTEIMIGVDPTTVCFPKESKGRPFALFLQGANVERKFYGEVCRRVAAYGFVVVIPDHRNALFNGLFPEASQLVAARDALAAQAKDAASVLHEAVDVSRFAVLGHSFGATVGLSLSEGLRDVPFVGTPEPIKGLRGVVLYAGGGQTMAIRNGKVPVAMVNGSLDSKSTADEARATYAALSGARKLLVEVDGLQHYGICDVDNPEGAAAETVVPETAQDEGVGQLSDIIGNLLRAFVFDDDAAWQEVTVELPGKDSRIHVTSE